MFKIYRHNWPGFLKETHEKWSQVSVTFLVHLLVNRKVALTSFQKKVLGSYVEFSADRIYVQYDHRISSRRERAHTQFMLLLFNRGHSRNKKYDFVASCMACSFHIRDSLTHTYPGDHWGKSNVLDEAFFSSDLMAINVVPPGPRSFFRSS